MASDHQGYRNKKLNLPVSRIHNYQGWKGDTVNGILEHFEVNIVKAGDLISNESEKEIDATRTCYEYLK